MLNVRKEKSTGMLYSIDSIEHTVLWHSFVDGPGVEADKVYYIRLQGKPKDPGGRASCRQAVGSDGGPDLYAQSFHNWTELSATRDFELAVRIHV